MKILKIRLKNIQSLYGEHEIDLTQPSFIENSLFLITGDTGSGKTTIFDAITLALYSQTNRYGRREKAEGLAESVMSRGTTECFAEVQFEVNGKQYKSRWEYNNKKLDVKNKATEPKMMLVNMEDETDNRSKKEDNRSKKKEVLREIEKITQLDFEQFLRSVMLAQGEFTRFLKAKHKERAELLEKMTRTEIYQQISTKVYEKHKKVKESLEILKKQKDAIQPLSPEDLEAKRNQKENVYRQIKILENQIQEIEPQIVRLERLEQIISEIATLQEEEKQIQKGLLDIAPQTQALAQHEKAVEFETTLHEIERLNKEINEKEQKIQTTQTQINDYLEKIQKIETQLKKENNTYQNFINEKNEKEKIVREQLIPLETQRNNLTENLKKIQEQIRISEEELQKIAKEANYSFSDSLQALEEKIQNLDKQLLLAQQEQKAKKAPEILQNERKNIQEIINHLQKWQNEAQRLSEKKDNLTKKIFENEQESLQLEKVQTEWEQTKHEISRLENEIALLQTIIEQERLIASYEAQRKHLRTGEPCPLCGSTHHPFAENLPHSELSAHETKLQNTQKQLKTLQKQLQDSPKKALEARLEQRNQEIAVLQNQIREIEQKMLAENIQTETLPQRLAQAQNQQKQIEQELENLLHLQKNINSLQSTISLTQKEKAIYKQKQELTDNKTTLANVEQKIRSIAPDGKNATQIIEDLRKQDEENRKKIENLQNQYNSLQNELKITESNFATLNETLQQNKQKLTQNTDEILPKILEKGFANLDDLKTKILPRETAQKYRKLQDDLQKEQQTTKALLASKLAEKEDIQKNIHTNASLQELKVQKAEISAQEAELNRLIGQIEAEIQQNEKNIQEYEKLSETIQQQEKEEARWAKLNHLIGSAEGDKFRKFAQSLTLQNLVTLANNHLKSFNNRYLIRKAEATGNTTKVENEGLELEIIDREQADTIRPIESLSGGESFLVSLSLALGLSDLASKNVKIDTLFIDEGFGTLDENTLHTAIDALEALQHKGKTIGIISHVKELKTRIKQQINVEKKSNGISSIKLPC
jgi:exonuclease SbcC